MPSKLNAISTGTPSLKFTAAGDGALEIQNDGNTAISISSAGVATFSKNIVNYVPTFRAYTTSNISAAATGVNKELAIQGVSFDVDDENNLDAGWYNNATGRYTPQTPGYYCFMASIGVDFGSRVWQRVFISLNGSTDAQYLSGFMVVASGLTVTSGSALLYLNGSTDYVSLIGTINYSSGSPVFSTNGTLFSGFLVKAA